MARLLWLLLPLVLPLSFFPSAWSPFLAVKADLFRALAIPLLALCLFRGLYRGFRMPGAAFPALAVAVGASLHYMLVPGGGDPWGALDAVLGAGLFLAFLQERDPRLPGKMLAGGLFSALLSSAYGVAQFAGVDPLVWRGGFAGGAPASTFGNPLFLADWLAPALPVALAMAWRGGTAMRMSGLIFVLVLSAGLLATQARGAWLGAGVALAAFLVMARRLPGGTRLPARWLLACGLGVIMVALAFSRPGPWSPRTVSVRETLLTLSRPLDGGFRGRFLLWESTALMVRERPLVGWGGGGFARQYGVFQGGLLAEPRFRGIEYHSTGHAHQDALQLWAERGALGLGMFVWMVVAVGRRFWRYFLPLTPKAPPPGRSPARKPASPGGAYGCATEGGIGNNPSVTASRPRDGGRQDMSSVVAFSGVAVLLFDSLFNGPCHLPPSAQWMWMLLAIAAFPASAAWSIPAPVRLRPRGRAVLAVLFIVLAVAAVRPHLRDLAGEGYRRAAEFALEDGDPGRAWRPAVDSLALSSGDRRNRFLLGRVKYGLGDWAGARDWFALDVARNPGMATGWRNLGVTLLRMGDRPGARESLLRAKAIDPTDKDLDEMIRSSGAGSR